MLSIWQHGQEEYSSQIMAHQVSMIRNMCCMNHIHAEGHKGQLANAFEVRSVFQDLCTVLLSC